jgi:hypothetical protein
MKNFVLTLCLIALCSGCVTSGITSKVIEPPAKSKSKLYPNGYVVEKNMIKAPDYYGGFWYVEYRTYKNNEEQKYIYLFTNQRYQEILGNMFKHSHEILVIPIKEGQDPFADERMDSTYESFIELEKHEVPNWV